jgi:hypothetical protein
LPFAALLREGTTSHDAADLGKSSFLKWHLPGSMRSAMIAKKNK